MPNLDLALPDIFGCYRIDPFARLAGYLASQNCQEVRLAVYLASWIFRQKGLPDIWLARFLQGMPDIFPARISIQKLLQRSLARVGYGTKPLSCAWITTTIIYYSISTGHFLEFIGQFFQPPALDHIQAEPTLAKSLWLDIFSC